MNDGYGIFTYNPHTDKEIDHYETRFLYGSMDGRFTEKYLIRELVKEEHNAHSRESIRENPSQTPLDVKKALFYEKELNEEDMEGYKMVLLAKISEPVYVK